MCKEIIEELKKYSDSKFAEWLKPFLSIDENSDEIIIGVRVPILRKLAKKYKNIDRSVLQKLLRNKIHDIRALAIFIMLLKVKKEPQEMCELYLNNMDMINNWDLIDYSAPYIVAPNVAKDKLREMAKDKYLWANRVAMVSTIYYIKRDDYELTLEFAERFISHPHHLMHKAAGWMLREIGKRNLDILVKFLEKNSEIMPSIMRSYAKERLK